MVVQRIITGYVESRAVEMRDYANPLVSQGLVISSDYHIVVLSAIHTLITNLHCITHVRIRELPHER